MYDAYSLPTYSSAFVAATCSQAVRLIPWLFAAWSMRFKSAESNRMLTVVFPASGSAAGAVADRGNPAPEMKAAAFCSGLAGFTAWGILIGIVYLLCIHRIYNG